MTTRNKLILLAKIVFSALLIFWLVCNDQFNYENISLGLSNKLLLTFFISVRFIQLALSSVRTHLLTLFKMVEHKQFLRVFKVSWASQLVAVLGPSSLIAEAYRVKELININRDLEADRSLYASLFTKVLSTIALISIAYLSGVMLEADISDLKTVNYLMYFITIVFVVSFSMKKYLLKSLRALSLYVSKFTSNNFINIRWGYFLKYCEYLLESPKVFLSSFVISLIIHILNTICFLLIVYTLNPGIDVDPMVLCRVIPLGIFFITLPISFANLGVGHVAFSKIFSIYGISNGADIFTIYFVFSFIFGLLGLIPYFNLLQNKRAEIEMA